MNQQPAQMPRVRRYGGDEVGYLQRRGEETLVASPYLALASVFLSSDLRSRSTTVFVSGIGVVQQRKAGRRTTTSLRRQ